ncbi:DUF4386 domain-containing protein [bacterium SCSIO 12643]|nr:DUF4386 domain-containing protein [bacterium SCSIO 12643]
MNAKQISKATGSLILLGMIAGIFSVAPAIDSTDYLTLGAANFNQVILAAIFQLLMSLTYMGIAILLYPIIRGFNTHLSLGFLSFRIIAVTLSIVGTLLLLSTLILSQDFTAQLPSTNIARYEIIGHLLKSMRDYINHVFMVVVLCLGNIFLYLTFIKSKLIPRWLSIFGIISCSLSVLASLLVLFGRMDIITPEYLLLNAPTGIQELTLAFWLIFKGLNYSK